MKQLRTCDELGLCQRQFRTCDELGVCQGPQPACTAECHLAINGPRQSPAFAPGTVDGPYARPRFLGRHPLLARVLMVAALFVAVAAVSMCAGFSVACLMQGGAL